MKNNLLERFLKYVSFDTQSSEETHTHPSTDKQKELAKFLVNELKNLGIDNAYMDEYSYVYAKIDSNNNSNKTIGLIAHLDTALESSGKVNPKVITSYDGKTIELINNDINPNEFSQLKNQIGHTLVTTDGTSLLGGDDKAGISVIMTYLEEILEENCPHPNLFICFTPDEEIGEGTEKFNYDYFKVDFAYTLDGGPIDVINYENFNAASAKLVFKGKSIHPGSAKGKMVNSQLLAIEFNNMLPSIRPDNTEGYEGFNHITSINGGVEETIATYIIRNHDQKLFQSQKEDFINITKKMNEKYGYNAVNLTIIDSYQNMKELVMTKPFILDYAVNALKECGHVAKFVPIRGGTDGARLTYNGIITPNLGNGDYNCHGPKEYVDIDEAYEMVSVLKTMLKNL